MIPAFAADVLNSALLELGLVSAALDNPYTSSDVNVVQMRAHLRALGDHLARLRPWSHLQQEWLLETQAGTESYALPPDWSAAAPSTEWNRTTDLRLGGPLNGPQWQVLKSSGVVNPVNYYYRITRNRLHLHPTPQAVDTLVIEYVSHYWVQPASETYPTTYEPSGPADRLWFDAYLLSRGVKLRFLEAKGMDTAAAENEYQAALSMAMGNDGAQPVLSLSGGGACPTPRLPETNWGV